MSESSNPKPILVTGGCGFIGANLVPKLEERGYAIRVLDNLSKGDTAFLDGTDVDIRIGDIRDRRYPGSDPVSSLKSGLMII